MDRHEWAEIVGDKGTVADDLRWSLFHAERCVTSLVRDESADYELEKCFVQQAHDARIALAAIWKSWEYWRDRAEEADHL